MKCGKCSYEYTMREEQDDVPCPGCARAQMSAKNSSAPSGVSRVTVVDFDMPFGSMVRLMVKWALASIPAFIILFVLGAFLLGLLGGIGRNF